jgi:hypothetical protein
MRKLTRSFAVLSLVALGYFLGANQNQFAVAYDEDDDPVEAAIAKAQSSLEELKTVLTDENRYTTATKTLNVSSLMAGGVDAIGDLEAGRGVDPETFAALYAGQAADEIAAEIDKDEKGRLTYKGKVVRLYSITRLKQVYQARIKYAGDSDDQPLAF